MGRLVSFFRFSFDVLKVTVLGTLLYIVALGLAIGGRKDLLRRMHRRLRYYGLLPPTTQEEKNEALVRRVTFHFLLRGHPPLRAAMIAIVYFIRGKRMSFVDEEIAELKDAMNGDLFRKQLEKDDAGLIISVTSMLDQLLGLVLIIRFPVDLTKTSYERVFGANGPLGTFSSKIALASVLGLTVGDMWNDLSILRRLRNHYAHAIFPKPLTDNELSKRCLSLKLRMPLKEDVEQQCKTIERHRIVESASSIVTTLTVIAHRFMAERKVVTLQQPEISREMRIALKEMGMTLPDPPAPATSPEKSP